MEIKELLGISNQKFFQKSHTNTIDIDLQTYRIVRTNQFAYNRATTRNGDKISIALRQGNDCIVSPSYRIFKSKDENVLNSEYLMMWFRRPEFDRYVRFKSHGSAHEFFEYDQMCQVELPIPSIVKQKEIVAEYNTVQNRIDLNKQLIQKLEETAQVIYKNWFVDFEFPDENGKPYKSNGGEMVESEMGEIPKGWSVKRLEEIGKVIDSLHITPEYSSHGVPMVRVTDINPGFLDLSNTMLVEQTIFQKFSKNHNSRKGDIVVSRVGATFGEFSYAHTNEKFCLGQNTAVIIPTIIDSKLMYTALTTSNIRNQIETKAVGSAYSTLSLQDIKELTFILPDKDFEAVINAIDKLDVLFTNQSLSCQEVSSLIKIRNLLLSKLATIEN
jgi:type I restriction enzyme, S subunit